MRSFSVRSFTSGVLSLVGVLFFGCLSYSYSGLTDEKALPTQAVVGMTFEEVVARFGAPNRIVSLSRPGAGPVASGSDGPAGRDGPETKGGPGEQGRRNGILLLYVRNESYQVLLYQRQRGHEYVFTLDRGRVVAFRSGQSRKADGITFSILPGGEAGQGVRASRQDTSGPGR